MEGFYWLIYVYAYNLERTVCDIINNKTNIDIEIANKAIRATGDTITPREIEYNYKMLFEDRELQIMTYNIESIIAEKFQTVILRGILNSR